MDDIKVEIASCCFLCLQSLPQNINSEEQINLTNLFFKYLKIRDEIKTFVCGKCGENMTKFVKLYNTLEKVRMEMDYLLDSIKGLILNSNYSNPANFGVASARGIVLEKCLEKKSSKKLQIVLERLDTSHIKKENNSPIPDDYLTNCNEFDSISGYDIENRKERNDFVPTLNSEKGKPQVILQRLDISKLIKREIKPPTYDCTDDWPENLDISNSIDIDNGTPAAPVINEIVDVKCEGGFQNRKKRKRKYVKAKCAKCSKTFRHKYALKTHYDAVHLLLKPFKCPTCHKPFFDNIRLRAHINAVHLQLKMYKCDMCDKSFGWPSNLLLHKYSNHIMKYNPNRYKCDICEKCFVHSGNFKRHKATCQKPKVEVNPDSKMHFCEICKKTYANKDFLQDHNRRVHTTARFHCDLCDKTFKSRKHMRRHVSGVHEKQRKHCQVPGCNKSCSFSSSLRDHYMLEHPDFTLDLKPPRIKNYLQKVEGGEIVFECKYCRRMFKSLKSVNNHLSNMHLREKIICADCGYTTRNKEHFKSHVQRRHKTDDGIDCKICKKQFSSVQLLQVHSRNAHGPKRFKCEFCDVAVRRKDYLKRHVKNNHKNK